MHPTKTLHLPAARPLHPGFDQDRLPLRLAAPVLLALSVLSWLAVWGVARILF